MNLCIQMKTILTGIPMYAYWPGRVFGPVGGIEVCVSVVCVCVCVVYVRGVCAWCVCVVCMRGVCPWSVCVECVCSACV